MFSDQPSVPSPLRANTAVVLRPDIPQNVRAHNSGNRDRRTWAGDASTLRPP